ncbi:hypothetical protein A3Q56_07788, partial [Intoshia linei]
TSYLIFPYFNIFICIFPCTDAQKHLKFDLIFKLQIGNAPHARLTNFRNSLQSNQNGHLNNASLYYTDNPLYRNKERGITMDVMEIEFELKDRIIHLVDTPGHKDLIPTMIKGVCGTEVGIIVLSAHTGEFESGFSESGQTLEHLKLARILGINFLICLINKMDTVLYSQNRFNQIQNNIKQTLQKLSFKAENIQAIPISALKGDNVSFKSTESQFSWYNGPTLVDAFSSFHLQRNESYLDKPTQIYIDDIYKNGSVKILSVQIISGWLTNNMNLTILPHNENVFVKSISKNNEPVNFAFYNDSVDITVKIDDKIPISRGNVLSFPNLCMKLTQNIIVKLQIFNLVEAITKGFECEMFCRLYKGDVSVSKIIGYAREFKKQCENRKPRLIYIQC